MKKTIVLIVLFSVHLVAYSQEYLSSDPREKLTMNNAVHFSFDTVNKGSVEPAEYEVISYQMSLLEPHKDLIGPYAVSIMSHQTLDISIWKMLRNARHGDKLFIEEIIVRDSTDGKKYFAPSVIKIL